MVLWLLTRGVDKYLKSSAYLQKHTTSLAVITLPTEILAAVRTGLVFQCTNLNAERR